ncbi:FAD-dependent oxidoreductase [Acidaminobacter sp. JC074]|uniref:NAD(P)/FAD-dependent oxidoreductase n=1 Tax=Acidaminobacter sp. JC074 TaxID=2530199 RepID=UPI001F0E9084|nr:NAD(P)/FAD-dependent oxidoreductase [Acidaminobacter sp. JC074]MCH4889913.1 FAD-dependent oxidoreductase [Acidaminobacter sp. JC074]
MKHVEVLVVGGGPAGLCAAISAASAGAEVMLCERSDILGGQLIKQTHMFFGSEKQYAGTRGIDITDILIDQLKSFEKVEILKDANVLSVYEDGVISIEQRNKYFKVRPERIIIATGASEKSLAFPNNDMPGIYGAGAVQTLMNIHGVRPGHNVLMVGAGNIGLIVSYQLMQAGVNVKAILDASPTIGGYLVHASKIRRMGVPILTGHTVKRADGIDSLESATIVQLDDKWQQVPGTEQTFDVDVMCVSVGLSPLSELLFQSGCEMRFVREFGGYVPLRDKDLKTSSDQIYIAGDVGGIEEASSAMVEGHIAGLAAAKSIGKVHDDFENLYEDYHAQLSSLRAGHAGDHIRAGMAKASL